MPSDSRALAHHEEPQAGPPDRFQQQIQMVREAMLNPDVNADKAKVMADLMTSLEDRALAAEFNRDLNSAMREMPVITKEGLIIIKEKGGERVIQRTRFAKFEDIDRVCRPILDRYHLAIRFEVGESNQTVTVRPIISHANGHTERGDAMRGPIDSSGSKNNVQGAGSTVSYLKRYTYCAALNIITEGVDDDGNQGRGEIVSMPHEREQLVLREAEAAHLAGRYLEHFASLGPKDRAWLISSNHHQRFGGQAALPGGGQRSGQTADDQPPVDQGGGPKPEPEPKPKPKPQSAAEWVKAFKGDLDRRTSLDKLDEYMEGKREALDKLNGSDPALWEETQQAYRDRRQAIEEGRLV